MGMGDALFSIFTILRFLFYIIPIVFVIWFLIKYLHVQQEKNEILKSLVEKIDKKNE